MVSVLPVVFVNIQVTIWKNMLNMDNKDHMENESTKVQITEK